MDSLGAGWGEVWVRFGIDESVLGAGAGVGLSSGFRTQLGLRLAAAWNSCTTQRMAPSFSALVDTWFCKFQAFCPYLFLEERISKNQNAAGQQPRYPVCFLTNGGGVTEAHKAAELRDWLGIRVGADQVPSSVGSGFATRFRVEVSNGT